MRVLVLASEVPATTSMPGSPRLYNICRELSASHELVLLMQSSSDERLTEFLAEEQEARVFAQIEVLPSAPAPNWFGNLKHRIRREPYFRSRLRSPTFFAETCRVIEEAFDNLGCQLVYADGLGAAQFVEGMTRRVPSIVDLHDCMSLYYQRQTLRETHWLKKVLLWSEMRSMMKCERNLDRTFDTVITNSPVDTAHLKQVGPALPALTIGNGVDSNYFASEETDVKSKSMIFTGVMSYAPNADAAVYFCESIFPLIRTQVPDAEFWIVGKDPTDAVKQLVRMDGVHVTGGVPDIRPYVRRCAVFVSPLREGTGIKNKLLAALSMRKAIVASSRSIEGLDITPGEHVLLADAPAAFASCAVQLLSNPQLASVMAQRGRALVEAKYSWEASARAFEATLCDVLQTGRIET